MLTQSDLKQIKDYLALYGKKDSQLLPVSTVNNVDYLTIIQDGKNVSITIELLKQAVLEGIITDEEFNDLWDEVPTKDSRKAVRSNGIWEDSQDLHNKTEKFTITLSASPSELEINGSTLTSTLTKSSKVETFGDAGSTPVTPDSDITTVNGGSLSENTWTLPNTVGTYTASRTATKNSVEKTVTTSVKTYLRKYFSYASDSTETIPSDFASWTTYDNTTRIAYTVTLNATGATEETKWRYIWFAVPNNMSISKVVQTSTGYTLALHDFTGNNKYYTTATRTIDGINYTYKLYRSKLKADSTFSINLNIS